MQLQSAGGIAILVLATEAITELIFKAGPLQGIREWIIQKTPWLYSEKMYSHLLECKYCVSVWVGFGVVGIGVLAWDCLAVQIFFFGLATHRLSNFIHLGFSYLRDLQMDLRVNRRE